MSVHRFLSRREKKPHHSSASSAADKHLNGKNDTIIRSQPSHFGGLFTLESAPRKDKEHERRVAGIQERLRHYGIDNIVESNIDYALKHCSADSDAAFRLIMLLEDTYEGLVKPYNAGTKLLGAVNRESVTCYLDALLFAMFARLDSFEAMLYDSFEDVKRRKLAGLLRLWVNLLRTGRLITTDITRHLQDSLAECGWADAAKLRQQDPSEAFTFITGQLELPLLTLKMDLYHTGKEDPQDDHKFINERLLEVALPEKPAEGSDVITLEDCLEHYFNNRIEVKRHLENQRRNTLKSISMEEKPMADKLAGIHVEVAEVAGTPRSDSPIVETFPIPEVVSDSPTQAKTPVEKLRPVAGRKRTDSIFSQRRVELAKEASASGSYEEERASVLDMKGRKLSTRTEVLMPAWQFFKLLPWYTDHMPTSDAQVAAHFAKKRPTLGICLKRYSYTMSGQATRLNTFIDIPLEIAVPNFVSDDNMDEEGPLVGNFRLLLQSVVCHRGASVNSGHYISLCRGRASNGINTSERADSSDSDDDRDPWMRFDDLAKSRVTYVDIHEALKQETPYLLFYQVQPIGEDGHSLHDLPTYAEATSRSHSDITPLEKTGSPPYFSQPPAGSETALTEVVSNPTQPGSDIGAVDFAPDSRRPSSDGPTLLDGVRGRTSTSGDERRRSIAFDDSSFSANGSAGGSIRTETDKDTTSCSVPSTPSEEKQQSSTFLAVANKIGSRRGSKAGKGSTSRSRPSSRGPAGSLRDDVISNRFSLNMSKLTQKMSRGEQPPAQQQPPMSSPPSTENGNVHAGGEEPASSPQPPPPAAAGDASRSASSTAFTHAESAENTDKHTPLPAYSVDRNPSKESVAASKSPPPILPSTTRKKEKEKLPVFTSSRHNKSKSHGHRGDGEDRDCVVM